ncbi:MAG: hypothetical protein U0414_36105 [Polyangiaceae bacterium]
MSPDASTLRPCSIQEFAAIKAELDRGAPPLETLRRRGFDPSGWKVVEQRWLDDLKQEVARGELARARLYQSAYEEAVRCIESGSPVPPPEERRRPSSPPTMVLTPSLSPPPADAPRLVIGSRDVSATAPTPMEFSAAPKRAATAALPSVSIVPPTVQSGAAPQVLPLERYVYVSAMLTVQGNTEANLARAGIHPHTWRVTTAEYATRFAADPQLEARFRDMLQKALAHTRA